MTDLRKVENGSLPFVLMDRMDDKLILEEIEGRISDTWVYHFEQGGKQVWGLSKVGIDQCSREMAKSGEVMRVMEESIMPCPMSDEHVIFKAKVARIAVKSDGTQIELDNTVGTKRQWIRMMSYGKVIDDPFFIEKGMSKAIRNAKAALTTDELKAKIIAKAKEERRVKKIADGTDQEAVNGGITSPPQTEGDSGVPPSPESSSPENEDSLVDKVTILQMLEEKTEGIMYPPTEDKMNMAVDLLFKKCMNFGEVSEWLNKYYNSQWKNPGVNINKLIEGLKK